MFEVACLSVLAKLVTCAGCILACTSDSWVLVQTCFSGFLQACSPSAHVGYFPQFTAWLFSLLVILNLPLVWQMMQKVMQKWKKKKSDEKKNEALTQQGPPVFFSLWGYSKNSEDETDNIWSLFVSDAHYVFAHHVCPSHSPKRSGFEIYQGFFGNELMTFWL